MKKNLVGVASKLFPKQVASFAYKQLTNPQIKKLRPHEEEVLAQAQTQWFPFGTFDIKLYQWGNGAKKVLLIHGWEGQAGNFSDLIEELLAQDYTIYAFDAPGHGYSSRGKTSLFEFTELVAVLIKKYQVATLISHSFGGVATTYALYQNKDLLIDQYVLLTTPNRFIERINDVAATIGISQKVKNQLIDRLEKETNQSVENLNVSDFVPHINVKQALIIHDTNDKVIPIERSKTVCNNWQACQFVEVQGTGHFRILRDSNVIQQVLGFLN